MKEARKYPHLVGHQEPFVCPSAMWHNGWANKSRSDSELSAARELVAGAAEAWVKQKRLALPKR